MHVDQQVINVMLVNRVATLVDVASWSAALINVVLVNRVAMLVDVAR